MYWIEQRGAGDVLVAWVDDMARDVLPEGIHVGSGVHEYGGGAYAVHEDQVWFVRAEDQRIWRYHGGALRPLTSMPDEGEHRYGDLQLVGGEALVCVRERHRRDEVVNELVWLRADGSTEPQVIAHGWDFYSSPRPNACGTRLAWITWSNPLMPWDGTWLWTADLGQNGQLGTPVLIAGGAEESISQPMWDRSGVLHYMSDRSGWWNLERHHAGRREAVISMEAELAPAAWELGYSTYQFLEGDDIAVVVQEGSQARLGIAAADGSAAADPIPLACSWIKPYLAADGQHIAIIGATADQPAAVLLTDRAASSVRQLTPVPRPSAERDHQPEPISFVNSAGERVHGLLHLASRDCFGAGQPLLVRPHPGPTANVQVRADPWIAFFTGYGFAVLEIDYSGSTGYGRRFRNALRGRWGELDARDCMDAVTALTSRGDVDLDRVAIHGSSAGGYTALRALAISDRFAAAVVRHAVIDPDEWRRAAPKFQAHHADLLVAPSSRPDVWQQRSVFSDVEAIAAPVLIIHGELDTITPIGHAQRLADMMGERACLLTFTDEGHSLRRSENQTRALDAELAHFTTALGL